MGRLGPLTSQALGRSPYDIVVQGEGEGDPRAPLQMYDERGRPVNPETKRINKDVVRSHNEVMLVIGVAEPEDGGGVNSERSLIEEQSKKEEQIGQRLTNVALLLRIGGLWGIDGLRRRILVYRQYSMIPFYELHQYERTQRSLASCFLSGLPSAVAAQAIESLPSSQHTFLGNFALGYVQVHLEIFMIMQQLGLASSTSWFPNPRFLIPFSAMSPIQAPPPITSFSPRSVLQWLGIAALNAAPALAVFGLQKLRAALSGRLARKIRERLPAPVNKQRPAPPQLPPEVAGSSQLQNGTQPRSGRDMPREEGAARSSEGQPPPEHPAVGAVRRQSTFSNRGDEYVSEDEETEIVSATLISFDVEATESTDTPPGVWSAELRPNVVGDPRMSSMHGPIYMSNTLTRLPSSVAADILSLIVTHLLTSPYEAFTLRLVARAVRQRLGLPALDMYELAPSDRLSWGAVTNVMVAEMAHLMIGSEIWGAATGLSELYRGCNPEWNFFRVIREKWKSLDDDAED